MAELTLIRPEHNFPNRFTDYSIYVNGKHTLDLGKGNKKTINVDSGDATVKAKVRFWGSQNHNFNLTKDDQLKLKVSGNAFFNRLYGIFVLTFSVYLLLNMFFDISIPFESSLHFISTLSIIGVIFIAIFKRNSWLSISPVEDKYD